MDFRLQAGMEALTFNCDGSGRTAYEAVTSSSCVTDVNPYAVTDDGDGMSWRSHLSFLICHLSFSEAKHQVVIAAGSHLFPFRTEKLSPPAPMVLQCNAGE